MNYIYQHTDSKILKLGIKWALYREDTPERTDFWVNKNMNDVYYDASGYLNAEKKHLESLIGYMKEPEFKVVLGENVYKIGFSLPHTIKSIVNSTTVLLENNDRHEISTLSHYYPGQQVKSFKYVRLGKDFGVGDNIIINDVDNYDGMEGSITDLDEDGNCVIKLTSNKEIECHVNDLIQSGWQEVEQPEPMLIGETKYHEPTYEPNPEHTQFQEELKSGVILLTPKE